MDISSLGNFTAANRFATEDTGEAEETAAETDSQTLVSNESQTSLLPPPQEAGPAENENANIQSPEQETGNSLNVIV
ncbi:MAG: hypothetical protein V3U37_05125 [Nitrospinaceae bacterium]